jgi:hypothetical protein
MRMPKVTLLADEWKNYLLAFGKGIFEFKGGVPLDVPVAVALEATKRMSNGKPMFSVDELPEIVEGPEQDADADVAQQNVASKEGRKARHLTDQTGLFAEG